MKYDYAALENKIKFWKALSPYWESYPQASWPAGYRKFREYMIKANRWQEIENYLAQNPKHKNLPNRCLI